jgi:hypothetical protein
MQRLAVDQHAIQIEDHSAIVSHPQSEITNWRFPRRQERQDQKGSLGKTNGTSEGPMSALSGSLVERSEHRILGDLGVMAVQVFSRIRLISQPSAFSHQRSTSGS